MYEFADVKRLIHIVDSKAEIKHEKYIGYDDKNNIVFYKDDITPFHIEMLYDDNDNIIHIKNFINNYEVWKEFDMNKNLIAYKNNYGKSYGIKFDNLAKLNDILEDDKFIIDPCTKAGLVSEVYKLINFDIYKQPDNINLVNNDIVLEYKECNLRIIFSKDKISIVDKEIIDTIGYYCSNSWEINKYIDEIVNKNKEVD